MHDKYWLAATKRNLSYVMQYVSWGEAYIESTAGMQCQVLVHVFSGYTYSNTVIHLDLLEVLTKNYFLE